MTLWWQTWYFVVKRKSLLHPWQEIQHVLSHSFLHSINFLHVRQFHLYKLSKVTKITPVGTRTASGHLVVLSYQTANRNFSFIHGFLLELSNRQFLEFFRYTFGYIFENQPEQYHKSVPSIFRHLDSSTALVCLLVLPWTVDDFLEVLLNKTPKGWTSVVSVF